MARNQRKDSTRSLNPGRERGKKTVPMKQEHEEIGQEQEHEKHLVMFTQRYVTINDILPKGKFLIIQKNKKYTVLYILNPNTFRS